MALQQCHTMQATSYDKKKQQQQQQLFNIIEFWGRIHKAC